jgi:hypothetical protein
VSSGIVEPSSEQVGVLGRILDSALVAFLDDEVAGCNASRSRRPRNADDSSGEVVNRWTVNSSDHFSTLFALFDLDNGRKVLALFTNQASGLGFFILVKVARGYAVHRKVGILVAQRERDCFGFWDNGRLSHLGGGHERQDDEGCEGDHDDEVEQRLGESEESGQHKFTSSQ